MKEELIGQLIFDSIDEAEIFYICYAKEEGFDVRRRSMQKKGEVVKNRVWVCNRAGFREENEEGCITQREAKPFTRCGCKASLRVSRDWISGKYIVSRFSNNHNHELHGCMKSYLSPSDKSMLSLMTKIGFKPSQVMHYLEQLAGGAGKLSFRRKAGYNWLNKLRAERIREGDLNTAINNMKDLQVKDERFFYKYSIDEKGILNRLFWCDGSSRAEYDHFGDVLVFDSTYKTNRYLYPLVIFSGVNNHGSTCIFAACFLQNETTESYQWVLQTFLESMGGKIPEAVLTDQDAAMRAAIVSEFVGTRHRICSWHLCRNVRKNIKNSAFCNEFCSLIDRKCSIEDFELSWSNIVEKYNLSNNKWVVDTYGIRDRWAEAFFRAQFMSMMTTTQRAESVNSLIKLSVDHKMTITDFLEHYKRTLQRIRSDFIHMQNLSENQNRGVRESSLKSFDEQALSICTLKIYYIIRKEIRDVLGVIGESRSKNIDGNDVFVYRENKEDDVAMYTVIVDQSSLKFQCDCMKLESEGVPCRHIISSLQYLRFTNFPDNMIKRRWLKEPGMLLRNQFPEASPVADSQELRFGELNKECLILSYVSSQTEYGTSNSMKRVRKDVEIAKDELMRQSQCSSVPSPNNKMPDNEPTDEGLEDPPVEKMHTVRDPFRNKTRGAAGGKKQKCGICGVLGHKATTCELKKTKTTPNTNESSTPGENSTQIPESSAIQSNHLASHSQNVQNLGSYGTLAQFPVVFNMPPSSPIVLNMPPNTNGLPLYSPVSYSTVFGVTGMGSLGIENVLGPNTSLLWQQEVCATTGSASNLHQNLGNSSKP
ncbi:hypothetical protein RD792_014382 [Penstemon davidsonii]|uniref:SWIM-type domain-containing protein n=1 Tax=Penstemon davidsonii TaxID=160366 RepID=A0ABR0CP62_9LAMI|nr:hypothetical protein RD792_014382 [Penstemon davidsonii]